MSLDAWITLAVIGVLVVVFVTERIPPTVAMAGGVIVLYLAGVVDVEQAFGGFANSAPITVAALYVLAGAADLTGALSGITGRALGTGTGGSERAVLARVTGPTAASSAFIANTPLVAMLAPRITSWARRAGRSPSRLLIPLSYAALLGGVVTVLGTSTNLVVKGLLDQSGAEPLGVFEITPVGLPLAIVGVVVLVALAPVLLPARVAPDEELANVREFTIELIVAAGGPLPGRSVVDADLRNLQGVYLAEILREDQTVAPVSPDEVLRGGDRLVFVGAVDRVIDLQGVAGLTLAEEKHVAVAGDIGHQFYEVVVAEGSRLNGSTLKAEEFRASFGAAVVAVHRAGHRLGGKLGDLPLRAGDVLLLVGPEGFRRTARAWSDFSVIAPYGDAAPMRRRGARVVELATLAVILLAGSGLVDLTKAALGVALALIASRVVSASEARRSINLDIIVMIAFSFGLGAAAAQSGLARTLADGLLALTEDFGDLGVLAGIAVATLVATELLSNNAAAALMFPVAAATAASTGIGLRPLAVVILVMASCSFLTPIGYQTNTMIWGMGGYRFTDFTRVGIPLTIVTLVSVVLLTPLAFPLR